MSRKANTIGAQLSIDFNQAIDNKSYIGDKGSNNNGAKIVSLNPRKEIYQRILNRCQK